MKREAVDSEIVTFQSSDGLVTLRVPLRDGDVWGTQRQIAELYSINQSNASRHLRNAEKDGETTADSRHAFSAYDRSGRLHTVTLYNLDAILAVGYRAQSKRATEFRRWATQVLRGVLTQTDSAEIARLREENAQLRMERAANQHRYQLLEASQATQRLEEPISKDQHDRLNNEIRRIAILEVWAGDWPELPARGEKRRQSPQQRAMTGIRNALSDHPQLERYGRKGKRWETLPRFMLPTAYGALGQREVDVMRKLGVKGSTKRAIRQEAKAERGGQARFEDPLFAIRGKAPAPANDQTKTGKENN
jgi:prophage antirepressor-like protein